MTKEISLKDQESLLKTLKVRFEENMGRHEGIRWDAVQKRLESDGGKLSSLYQMEETGGEPDVVAFDEKTGEYVFYDCAPESPKGRRSVCYDHKALAARKKHKPSNSAVNMASEMNIDLLTEEEYRALQALGTFDLKSSSWIKTPEQIRDLGGAIFCDRRYETIFMYHNGADSYYGARGFRGKLKV